MPWTKSGRCSLMSGFRSKGGSMRKAAATSRRGGKQARNRSSGEHGRTSRKRPGGECRRLLSGDRRCISDRICHFPNSVTDSSAKEYHRLSEIMMWSSRDSFLVPALVSPYPLQSKPSSSSTLASTSPMLSPRALSIIPEEVSGEIGHLL